MVQVDQCGRMAAEREIGMDDLAILDEAIEIMECKRCSNFWTEWNGQQYNALCLECFIDDLMIDEPTPPAILPLDEGYEST